MNAILAQGWLHICLVMLFFSEVSSQSCTSLRVQLTTTTKNSLGLLKSKMRTNLPLQCLSDMRDFVATQEILKEIQTSLEENPKVAIHEIFQQIIRTFNQNRTETAWDENSMAAFQTRLHQQVQHLGRCLSAEMENDIPSPRGQNIQLTRLRVKRYFQRIDNFLNEKQHGLCAWAIVQIEVKQCLLLVDQLTNRIPI
ncbi:PREDICTED: interferon kappa-like [Gekko japonicus]|uniref:Interferon kappa-like n=1 Tax=Gekko japonicus TaxID=146911 RepID=A0ABM1JRF7_GEKJA|nr:PREDICTED: interferon kappa-like [Gekko japonicus]